MAHIRGLIVFLLTTMLVVSWVLPGQAGERSQTPVVRYEGQIKSIKIEKCGLQPGLCEGSIVLAHTGGSEVSLAIRVGAWIKRGDHLALIEDLGVGDRVRVQAFYMTGETLPRIAILEFTNP